MKFQTQVSNKVICWLYVCVWYRSFFFTSFRTKTFIGVLYPYRDIGAYVDLLNVIKSTAASENIPQSTVSNMALQSDAVFEAIKERVNADKAKAKAVNGVFLYKITVDGKIIKEWSK